MLSNSVSFFTKGLKLT